MRGQALSDQRFMAAAIALGNRGVGLATPNPSVGCLIVQGDIIVGRGWTQPGGRPHGEFMALAQAGPAARGATLYTTLEPCAHVSGRGPSCADQIIAAGVARVVVALGDPDPRTAGQGMARLQAAAVQVDVGVGKPAARADLRSHFIRVKRARAFVTLKVATSLDGFVADAQGRSQWITGSAARQHSHMERAQHDAIVVGAGTVRADDPALDVRLPGLGPRAPLPIVLSHEALPLGCKLAANPATRIAAMADPQVFLAELAQEGFLAVLVEGGADVAGQFLDADVVDRLLWYRAPIVLGQGRALATGSKALAEAHEKWSHHATRTLGADMLSEYWRTRE